MAKVPVMVEPDVVKAAAVANNPGWVPVTGVAKAKAKAVASKSRWAPGMVVAKVAVMAARGVGKAKAVASKS